MQLIPKVIIASVLFIYSCAEREKQLNEIPLLTPDDQTIYLNNISQSPAMVITFFSPECPISENYTLTINKIASEYGVKNIRFIQVFPGTIYSDEKIMDFITFHKLAPEIVLDRQLELTEFFGASVTPETFVLDNENNIIYSGAIDNWVVDLGSKRQVITEFYLQDALDAALLGKLPEIKKTKPVGCFIEKEN